MEAQVDSLLKEPSSRELASEPAQLEPEDSEAPAELQAEDVSEAPAAQRRDLGAVPAPAGLNTGSKRPSRVTDSVIALGLS